VAPRTRATRIWLVVAGLLASLAILITPAASAQGPPLGDGAGIDVVESHWVDQRLIEATVTTPALSRPAGVRILVPGDYLETQQSYPVLYLLHGGFGNFRDWTESGDASAITAGLDLIVVMPDGGQGGWYRNWHNFGRGGPPEWETFHIDQLIPWVDGQLRTQASPQNRAIAGLSMGGFGAMSYAGRHPDLFAAAASFSGAVNTRNQALRTLIFFSPLVDGGAPGAIYPSPVLNEPDWRAHNPWDLAPALAGMHVALYTGNGAPGPLDNGGALDIQEQQVHAMNVALHQRLDSLAIPHTWRDYGPGTHTWPYWQRDLREELPQIMATIGAAAAAPVGG
jgi:S-formylglutathione hydrolase FrmB